jgi:cell wall assembly regulator SMI1
LIAHVEGDDMTYAESVTRLYQRAVREKGGPTATPAGLADVRRAEAAIGMTFPRELSAFLQVVNGACVGLSGFYRIETARDKQRNSARQVDTIIEMIGRHSAWVHRHWIPVAADGCGNDYVLAPDIKQTYPVCFVNLVEGDDEHLAYAVASDIWHLLWFFLHEGIDEDYLWPFHRDYVLEHDPDIANVTVAPLPWTLEC